MINLDEMDRFFEKYKLSKLTQFLLNLLLKISPKNVQAQKFYWGFFQVFKEKLKEDFPTHKLVFSNTRTGQTLQNKL